MNCGCETIICRKDPPLGTITLNRPEVLNAINGMMFDEILEAVEDFKTDSRIRVVIINSACERAFSSGIDVAYVKDIKPWGARQVGKKLHEVFGAIRLLEKPVIVAIDGLCLGAGLELAISCDLLIATDRARFGLPNINVGIPAIVEAAILPQVIGVLSAKELCFTGQFWDAEKAERRGLLNEAVPPPELSRAARRWAEQIGTKSPLALATQKDIINKWMTTDLETAIDYSINTVAINWMTRDQKEGMGAFLEKRKAEFEGE